MEDSGKTDSRPQNSLRAQLYRETFAMAEYALANGKAVPNTAIRAIEQYERQHASSSIDGAKTTDDQDPIDALLAAHGMLTDIVSPAKPNTILLLKHEQQSSGFMKFLGPVSLVRQMMIAAIISLLCFIALGMTDAVSSKGGNIMSQSGIGLLLNLSFYLAAAGLGASFAALYKANVYIANGTFDPTYHASYWVSFFLGLIAGLILAVMVSEEYFSSHVNEVNFLEKGIVRPMLAMLGGFSADLTHTVLNRLVETIRSLFTGSPKAQIADTKKALQVDFSVQQNQQQVTNASNLLRLQQLINKGSSPEEINKHIDTLLNNEIPGAQSVHKKTLPEESKESP